MRTSITYINNRKKLIDEMIDARGYIYCKCCNITNAFKFHTHHIIFRSEKPNHKHLHNKENLIICCNECHNDFHNNKSLRNNLVENRKLYLLFGNDVRNKQ